MFQLLVFLHLALMFLAVALSYGPTVMFWIARRSGRTEPVRAIANAARPATLAAGLLYGVAGITGLIAALNVGYNLLAPWLVVSYVLFGLLTFIGFAISGPRMARLRRAVADAPAGLLTADVRLLVDDPALRAVHVLDFVLLFALVYDMVVKPFG